MTITVMSFNTQHCRNYVTGEIDFDLFAHTIRRCGADIVGLNEIRDQGDDPEFTAQARELAGRLGYQWYFAKALDIDGGGPYGNALLSRFPIVSAQTIPIPDPTERHYDDYYETRCLLKAIIAVAGGLNVLVSHFGLNPDEQENAVGTVLEHLPPKRGVLMGDFNMTPDDPRLRPIRQRLFDTAARFPAERLSFPSDRPDCKIDYIFSTGDVRVARADIPAIVASDHRPHTAVLEL